MSIIDFGVSGYNFFMVILWNNGGRILGFGIFLIIGCLVVLINSRTLDRLTCGVTNSKGLQVKDIGWVKEDF